MGEVEQSSLQEHRRFPRADIRVEAYVWTDPASGHHYEVANLSASGALLRGSAAVACGDTVQVSLHLLTPPKLEITAKVLRVTAVGADENNVAVEFVNASPDAEDRIQAAVLAFLEAAMTLVGA